MTSASRTRAWPLLAVLLLLFSACTRTARWLYMQGFDRDEAKATRSIEAASNDSLRAAGFSERGTVRSERARYCRSFNLIPEVEYDRLFRLSLDDHDRAVALAPRDADARYRRGRASYDRAALEGPAAAKPWFSSAAADFEKAIESDDRLFMAWDMLGLVHQQTGEMDRAINDFTKEMALDSQGRWRLADAHCLRGTSRQREKEVGAAIADFERAIELGGAVDGCSCEPHNPLLGLYLGPNRQYDKAWDLVHRAQKSGKWIAPELLESLKRESGRTG